jgi:hypothetical protein
MCAAGRFPQIGEKVLIADHTIIVSTYQNGAQYFGAR